MSDDREGFDELLIRLNAGDVDAAEQVFLKFETYLRTIVRRQINSRVRAKFDSSDVVQSVWADLVVGFREGRWQFDDSGHLQAFLVKATQNRFLDRVRQQKAPIQNERSLTSADADNLQNDRTPRPSQEVRLSDLWGELLKTCSESQRAVLELKRQGKSLAEIATLTGYHESSIRRILYDLARQFVSTDRGGTSNPAI